MAGPGLYYFFPTDYFIPPLYSSTGDHDNNHPIPVANPQIIKSNENLPDDHHADYDQRLMMKRNKKHVVKSCTRSAGGVLSLTMHKQDREGYNGQFPFQKSWDCEEVVTVDRELSTTLLLSYPVFVSSIAQEIL